MKNILIVTTSLGLGGSEKALLEMANAFDFERYNVEILTLMPASEIKGLDARIKVREGYLNFDVSTSIKSQVFKLIQEKKIGILFRRIYFSILCKINVQKTHTSKFFWKAFAPIIDSFEKKYDVVIGYGQGITTYFTLDKTTADKKIAWVNTDLEKARYDINYVKRYYEAFDYIFTDSENGKKNATRLFPLMNDKVYVFKNILNEENIKELSDAEKAKEIREDSFAILSIGRLVEAKAFHLAIRAAKILEKKGIEFVWYIVGEGSDREQLELLISELKMHERVKLLGKKLNPYPYIKKCDLYVQTSIYEGSCITIDEAMLLQKPLVTTDFPAAKEKVLHEYNGYIVEMNENAIASGVEKVINNVELRKKICSNLEKNKINYKEQMKMLYDIIEE